MAQILAVPPKVLAISKGIGEDDMPQDETEGPSGEVDLTDLLVSGEEGSCTTLAAH